MMVVAIKFIVLGIFLSCVSQYVRCTSTNYLRNLDFNVKQNIQEGEGGSAIFVSDMYHSIESFSSPSVEPSAMPTEMPTEEPTELPSAPTETPTASPSNKHTTQAPSTSPNFVPPTQAPSISTSFNPSSKPVFSPTFRPTPLPGDPTFVPTRAPSTARPSARPSATPSKQTTPIVSFTANLTLAGVTTSELDSQAQLSVVNATAVSMGVSMNTVSYVRGIATLQSTRRFLMQMSLFSTTYSIVAITKVDVPLSSTSFTSTTQLYTSLTTKLSQAVESGVFTTELNRIASQNNATSLLTVNVTSVAPSEPLVSNPEEDDGNDDFTGVANSNSDPLTDGAIAGIAIGGFFFVVITSLLVYYYVYVKGGFTKVADEAAIESRDRPAPSTQMISVVPA